MKTIFLITSIVLAIAMTSCGGKKGAAADSDSVAEAEILEAVAAVRNATYLTKDSVGTVAIGMPINEIPDSVAGLYNRKTVGDSRDAMSLVFSDEEGEEFVAYDFGEGNVDVINVIGANIKVSAPRGDIALGDSFSKVLELPGVTEEWSGYDNNGMWYWIWEGIWFAPAQDNLPAGLSQRLFHSGQPPTQADFTDEVKIGFIGTGLPF